MMTPNQIGVGRYDELLRSTFNIKGSPVAPELADVIGIDFSLPYRTEHDFLAGERLAWGRGQATAGVGVSAAVELRNPPGSGTLLIVDAIDIQSNTVTLGAIIMSPSPVALATPQITNTRDGRASFNRTVGRINSGTTAAPFALDPMRISGNRLERIPMDLVLAPDQVLLFEQFTANLTLALTIFWREHQLEPSEER